VALPLPLRKGFAFPIGLNSSCGYAAEAKPQNSFWYCGKPEAFRKESGKAANQDLWI